MKKLFGFVMVFLLLVLAFVPMNSVAAAKEVFRVFPSMANTVYQGESTYVGFIVENVSSRTANFSGKIVFSGNAYSEVKLWVDGKESQVSKTRAGWSYPLKGSKIKPNQSVTVWFSVKYSNQVEGLMNNAIMISGNGINQSFDVMVNAPALMITSSSPDLPVLTGGVPMTVQIQIQNPTTIDVSFDTNTVFPSTGATDGTYPRSIGEMGTSELYVDENGATVVHWWGNIPAGETYTMDVYTNSGQNPGTYILFGFDDLLSDVVYLDKMVVLEAAPLPEETKLISYDQPLATWQGKQEYLEFTAVNYGAVQTSFNWTINFKKSVFPTPPSVAYWAQNLPMVESETEWVYSWSDTIGGGKLQSPTGFLMTYGSQVSGLVDAITIHNNTTEPKWGHVIMVDVKVPALEWRLTAPSLVKVNTVFNFTFSVKNPSPSQLKYNLDAIVYTNCTYPGIIIREKPAIVDYFGGGSRNGYANKYQWAGWVQPGETLNWKFEVQAVSYPATCTLFVELKDTNTGSYFVQPLGLIVVQ